jgi:hypothetical protein|tara:strand:+ start:116853 stop:117020 length:168 start_codon:yes stop_codon:yes gene_type:complete
LSNQNNKKTEDVESEIDFHEAAVINEKGEEVAITEEMVREAINKIDQKAHSESGS